MAFYVLNTFFPGNHSKWYAPSSCIFSDPERPFPIGWELAFIFSLRRSSFSRRGLPFGSSSVGHSCCNVLLPESLHVASRIFLLSRSSLIKSRLTERLSSFRVRSNICLRMVGSPTSTEIIASVSYIRLYGVSCVDTWGV